MFRIYIHLGDAKFVVLIDPNATFEQLKREIFIVHNRCFPGLDLPSVSVIKSLCDHNGYMIADHYQVSSVIKDCSVLLAIVDSNTAVCSQGIMGFQGIGNQGSNLALPAMDNENPLWDSSVHPVEIPSRPSFPDSSSVPDLIRCPEAVNCENAFLRPFRGSRKRRPMHSKPSHKTAAHTIAIKKRKKKKIKNTLHACETLISSAGSKCEDAQNVNDLKSVSCTDNSVVPLTNRVDTGISVNSQSNTHNLQNFAKAKPKDNAGSLSSNLLGSCIPTTNNAKSNAISANSFLPAEVSDFSSDSEDECKPCQSTMSSSIVPVKPEKTITEVRKAVKKGMDPVSSASSCKAAKTILPVQATKGLQTHRNKAKNASGNSVNLVDRVLGHQPVRKVPTTESFLQGTSDDTSDSDSLLVDKQSHGKVNSTQQMKLSFDKVHLSQSDQTFVTSQVNPIIFSSDKTSSTCTRSAKTAANTVDDANLDNNSELSTINLTEQFQHCTGDNFNLQDVRQHNTRDDRINSTDINAQETQGTSEMQLDGVPSPEIPLVNDREKGLQDDEIPLEQALLPKARFLRNEKNEKRKTDQLSERTDKEACNTTCLNLCVAQGKSIVGSLNATDTSDQEEHNADAAKVKKVCKIKNKRNANGKISRKRRESSCSVVNSMSQALLPQQEMYAADSDSTVVDAQSSITQSSVPEATKCILNAEASTVANDATVSKDFDGNIAVAGENKGRRHEIKKDDPFDFVDDALSDVPLRIKVNRSDKLKKLNSSMAEDSSSDVEYNAGLAILVEDAKKCTPKNKKLMTSSKLPEITPNVKLSSAVFSLTPSTSTRKMGKQFVLERNKATVSKIALPEQNLSVNHLSQDEIRFSQDACQNLSKVFGNELWQMQP